MKKEVISIRVVERNKIKTMIIPIDKIEYLCDDEITKSQYYFIRAAGKFYDLTKEDYEALQESLFDQPILDIKAKKEG